LKLSGGELLLKCLEQEKVRFVFGIVGGQLLAFIDAIHRLGEDAEIRYIGVRHEEAAANMADAYARLTGNPGVCIGTVGPGAANLVPGLYPAYADSIPVVAITAQNQTWKSYPDHGSTQGLDQHRLFKGMTKWNAVVSHFQRIPEIIQRAFREATSDKPGPVHVDIPVDVLFGQGEIDQKLILPPESYRCLNPPAGNPEAIKKAAQMLVKAEFPLIHAGTGALWSNASKELIGLAEHLAAPMTSSPMARGVFPEDHPLALLTPGYGLLQAQPQADVVLLVGGRLGDYEMWGKPIMWGAPDKQKLIQIDITGSTIGLNRSVDIAIIGDAKTTLSLLLKEVKNLTPKRSENPKLEKARESQRAWLKGFQAAATSNTKPIHTLRAIKEVRDFFPRNAICCIDGGNTAVWSQYVNRIFEPRTCLNASASDSGHLGVGLPYAICAKLVKPDTPVYLITGDGAFMLSIHELETARRVGANIVAVVINDMQWGMIKGGQKMSFESRFEGVDLTDVRYDQVAKAMGCYGERVEDPTELKPALRRATESKQPAVLDVMVNKDIHLIPPDLGLILSIWLEGVKPPKIEVQKEEQIAEEAPEAEEA
jgi:acetolactate synthase-1/2/3 large subunit